MVFSTLKNEYVWGDYGRYRSQYENPLASRASFTYNSCLCAHQFSLGQLAMGQTSLRKEKNVKNYRINNSPQPHLCTPARPALNAWVTVIHDISSDKLFLLIGRYSVPENDVIPGFINKKTKDGDNKTKAEGDLRQPHARNLSRKLDKRQPEGTFIYLGSIETTELVQWVSWSFLILGQTLPLLWLGRRPRVLVLKPLTE